MPSVTIVEPAPNTIPVECLRMGQLGIGEDGVVYLRCYLGVVSLTDPRNTYSADCTIPVRPIPTGSVISFVAP
jgi:hypothetical protein